MAKFAVYNAYKNGESVVDRFDTENFPDVEMLLQRYPNQKVHNIGFGAHITVIFLENREFND